MAIAIQPFFGAARIIPFNLNGFELKEMGYSDSPCRFELLEIKRIGSASPLRA
jgi:hypothetical protein